MYAEMFSWVNIRFVSTRVSLTDEDTREQEMKYTIGPKIECISKLQNKQSKAVYRKKKQRKK